MTNEELKNLKIDDLVEVTGAQIFDEPKEMIVTSIGDKLILAKIYGIIPNVEYPIVSKAHHYKRAFLIPKPKTRPMTPLEVMKYCFDMEREEGVQVVVSLEGEPWHFALLFSFTCNMSMYKFGINHGTHVEEFELGYVPESGYAGLKSVISHEVRA